MHSEKQNLSHSSISSHHHHHHYIRSNRRYSSGADVGRVVVHHFERKMIGWWWIDLVVRLVIIQPYLVIIVLLTLLSPHRIYHHHNDIHAFRAISISSSLSSKSSSTLPCNSTTQRRTPHHVFHGHRKRSLLWQQQQQKEPEPGVVDTSTTTIDTRTAVVSTTSSNDDTVVVTTEPKHQSHTSIVLISAVGLLTTGMVAAMTGILPGYCNCDPTMWQWSTVTTSSIRYSILVRDVGSTIFTGILGYAFVQCITYLTVTKQYLISRDARKLIHTLSAPLFIVFWPLFTTHHPSSRVFAAIVPILNGIRLYIASQSSSGNNNESSSESALAQAVSRSGDSKEALGGPFIYVCMLATCILCFWTEVPHGIIAMSTLAAGDGMADIVGRRYGTTNPWPYNTKKSIIGSLAFVVASTITSFSLILWIQYTNSGLIALSSHYTTMEIATNIVVISTIAAIVETIPWLGDDNYTVPISAAILSMILLA